MNNTPETIEELFENGEATYNYIDYDNGSMDNIQSMQWFLIFVGGTNDHIIIDDGTQVILEFNGKQMIVDAGGLGDFYSHSFTTRWL